MFKNRIIHIIFLMLCSLCCQLPSAEAHTTNISSSRIVAEPDAHYRVDVGFLGTDIERMLNENKAALVGVDLTEPGLIEALVGKFIQERVSLQNETGLTCPSKVITVGEDPANTSDSKAVIQFDCRSVPGKIFYNPYRLLAAQGSLARHLVSIGESSAENTLTKAQSTGMEPAPGQVMIFPGNRPIALAEPLLGPWELAPKFF